MARRLSHYIAPDVCDEVEHCMHSLERSVKRSLSSKIAGCIEESIKVAFKEHAAAFVANDSDSIAMEDASKKQGRLHTPQVNVLIVWQLPRFCILSAISCLVRGFIFEWPICSTTTPVVT